MALKMTSTSPDPGRHRFWGRATRITTAIARAFQEEPGRATRLVTDSPPQAARSSFWIPFQLFLQGVPDGGTAAPGTGCWRGPPSSYVLKTNADICSSGGNHTDEGKSLLLYRRICYIQHMARGQSGRVVLEIDPALKRQIHARLAADGRTLKSWFLQKAGELLAQQEDLLRPQKSSSTNRRRLVVAPLAEESR